MANQQENINRMPTSTARMPKHVQKRASHAVLRSAFMSTVTVTGTVTFTWTVTVTGVVGGGAMKGTYCDSLSNGCGEPIKLENFFEKLEKFHICKKLVIFKKILEIFSR